MRDILLYGEESGLTVRDKLLLQNFELSFEAFFGLHLLLILIHETKM
jgi:hypothetical protein